MVVQYCTTAQFQPPMSTAPPSFTQWITDIDVDVANYT